MVLEVTKPEDLLKLLTAAAQQRFGFDHLIALTCAHPAATPIDILKAHNVAINGHARRGDGHRLHYYLRQLRSHGIQPDVATHDSIVLLHCVQGRMDLAERVLERMRNPKPAESTYSVIIRGYARCGDFEAVRVWSDKLVASGLTNGVLPVQLYATFISTYGFRGRLADARNAFAEAQARGVVNVALVAAWISVLGRSERVAEAEGVFREWKELSRTQRNAAGERSSQVKETPEAWTALIRARSSHPTRSKELWDEMLEEGVIPDSFAVYALVEHFVNVVTLKRSSDFAAARALVDRVLRLAHDMKQKYPEVVLDYFTFSPAFAWLVPPPPKTVERDMQSDTQAPSEFPVQQSAEVTETDMESVSTETVGLRRIQPTKAILSLVDSLSSSLSAIHPRFRSSPALMNSLAWRFAQSGDPRTAWVWVTKARELGNRSNAATYEEIIRAFLSLSPSKGGLSSVISLIQEMRRAGIQIADIELSQELLGKFLESGMVEDAVETLLQTEWKTHDTNGGAPEGTLPDALLPHLNHLLTLIPEHAASDPSRALRLITLLAPHIRHPDPCYPTVMDALSQAGQGFEAVRLWMQMRGRNIRPSRWSAEALMRAVRTESEIDIARAFVVEVREGKWATGADPIVWDLGLAQLYLQALGTCGTVEETIRVLLDIHDWASLTEEVYMSTVDHMRRHGRITDAREIEDFLEECAPEAIPMHASH
ncbi:hypothetical protein M427DRAFT_276802 [Gonapodya prolifera JEL478]|uniref:Pentacotripeptide-repeat region of PRORP domain-containing protein n=1 Tax=Gonapodya prolifera (strain JEL478) TaxID=1344416 RepID=A0A139AY74_GONPJ|nr:hypothetical protein M427DRAFT_276802 [Gonapodya prolifera JEL478]|eukprot:KXS21701.1 hypothetical protein M427DRAFT_276802 [Gonapodya prolifera JEL478]